MLVKPVEADEQTASGIIIPDTAQERPQEGHVVAVGSGGKNEQGEIQGFTVQEGDRVLYSKYGGTEIKLEGEPFLVIREEELLAVIKE